MTQADLPDPAKVPPEQNAVPLFEQALAELRLTDAETQLVSLADKRVDVDRVQFTPDERTELRRIWQAHMAGIGDLDRAAARPQCAWSPDMDHYFGGKSVGLTGAPRMVAQLLAEQALLDTAEGRGAEALGQLRRIMNVARIDARQPMFISALVAQAVQAMAVATLERLSPNLDWNDPAVISVGRQLLADLLAAQPTDFYHAFRPEFCFNHYWIEKDAPPGNWWIAPLLLDEEARGLERYAVNLSALHADSYPVFKARMVALATPSTAYFAHALTLFSGDVEMTSSTGLVYFDRTSDVRAAALLLAAQLYRHDHGVWPQNVAMLAPEYVTSVPRDPFDPAGGPMRYRMDATGPTVWSVGENGIDDGAAPVPPTSAVNRYRHPDILYGAAWRAFIDALPPP